MHTDYLWSSFRSFLQISITLRVISVCETKHLIFIANLTTFRQDDVEMRNGAMQLNSLFLAATTTVIAET